MWKRITFLLLLPIGTIAQRFPSPGIAFSTTFDDAAPEGIALLGNAAVYVTSNQQWMDGTFSQSWVHKLDPNSGDILQSRLLAQDRSKVGACTVLSPTAGGPRMLIINPWTGDADFNVGIQAIRTDTLQTLWTSNIVREADTGIPPIISPDEDIVYYSSSNGIAVLDKEGRTRWATTTIRTGQIAVTRTSIFAVDQTPREQYPLNVYSLVSGALTGTSGPLEGAPTSAGVVLSPDERSAYTVRSGTNGGLYQNRANFLFVPPTILTTDISSGMYAFASECLGV